MTNKEAIYIINNRLNTYYCTDEDLQALDLAIKALEERPQGEWIIQPHSMIMRCSLCGHEENAKDVGTINPDKHFCSFCGADMRGDKNGKSSN